MFRSIRWTLQLWHAGILLLALASFGTALYYGTSHSRFSEIDTELSAAAQVLAARYRPPPRPASPQDPAGPPRGFQDDQPPPRPEGSARPRPRDPERFEIQPPPVDGPPGQGPGRGRGPGFDGPPARRGGPPGTGRGRAEDVSPFDDPGAPRNQQPPRARPLPRDDGPPNRPDRDLPPMFRPGLADDSDAPYFIVWRPDGLVIGASLSVPDIASPGPVLSRPARAVPAVFRQRGAVREVTLTEVPGIRVLVGRPITRELNELHHLAWLLCVAGGGVMMIGLAGGWWLSRHTVKPIAAMSAAAQSISASNWSQRIDVNGTGNELTDLARVFNATFDRLEGAFQQQVRFTADASHELRTPLSVIHSQAELALSRERTAPEYRQTVEACLRAARRMKTLVESLLTLARADAGKLELKYESFELHQTIEECVDLVRPLAESKGVTLCTHLDPVNIVADNFRLTQVITNLLTNAIHYNRENGSVSAELSQTSNGVTITISDTGVGIAPNDTPHIFERFYRVDKARSRQAGGSGLGLAICKSIVEAHGGNITFSSKPGEGTDFKIVLNRR